MEKHETEGQILKNIFSQYILHNPVSRSLMLPVLCTMIVAKYVEVLCARQTENITRMIRTQDTNLSTLIAYTVVCIASIVLVEVQSFVICKAGQIGYRQASRDTFRHFLEMDPDRFMNVGKGTIQNVVSRRSQAVQDMIDVFTLNFFPTLLTMFFVSYEVSRNIGWPVVLIINCCIAVYVIVTIKITQWRNEMRKRLNIAQNNSTNLMMDSLSNFETVFSCRSEDYEAERYNESLKDLEKHSTEIARSLYLLNLSQKGVWCAMSIFIIFLSCYTMKKSITVEKFTFLMYITGLITKSLDNFGFMFGKYKTAILNAKVNAIGIQRKTDGYRTAFRLNKSISADQIRIRHGNTLIIDGASFKIEKGDKIAMIGENGSGKSTLLKSLIRLTRFEGELYVDGIKHKDLTDASIKSIISFVPQSAILFDGTVMSNIKYGNPKVFDEEVYRVSRQLGIHESITRLKDGYMTQVGEQGRLLSGGERQKILILRALLRQSSVLLLDEPTASLDKQAEQRILSTLVEIPDLTVVAIIHNLELLNLFNKILHVQRGTVECIQENINESADRRIESVNFKSA